MIGAQDAVKASRSASWALISASRISQRRAIARKAPLAEAVTEVQVADRRHLADDVVERRGQGCWRVDDDGLECDHGLRSALHGGVARHLQVPDHLDRAGAGFGLCVRLAAKPGACRALGVARIAFSVLMPELTIGRFTSTTVYPSPAKNARDPRHAVGSRRYVHDLSGSVLSLQEGIGCAGRKPIRVCG